MKLSAFKALLSVHPEKPFHLVLPDRQTVPVSFHITEVAHVQKRFIDCGGKLHTTDTCQLQAWLGQDTDHRLQAGKMARVLDIARVVLPEGQDLDIEIEYEDRTITQYPVESANVTEEAVVLHLGYKHTDCLARESCCPPQQTQQSTSLPRRHTLLQPMTDSACCGGSTTSGCCN